MMRLPLTADTIAPIARGHPWVYADGVKERAPAGTPVQLTDERGRVVAFGLADEGAIAVRVLGRHAEDVGRLAAARIASAAGARPGLLPLQTDAYRVVNGEGDGLPGLIIDRYGPIAVVRLYTRSWEPFLDGILDAAAAIPGVSSVARRKGVAIVDGSREPGVETLRGPPIPEVLVVQEAGLRFLVRPHIGQKTGLFLDQREHRRFAAGLARGRTMANLFGYTGGFSVHAAAAGAARVLTVDVAGPALEDAKENFRLNGMDPGRHGFLAADVFGWTPEAPLDFIICDPPNLSHDKSSDAGARNAYRDLAERCGKHVVPGGLLASSSCTARLSMERWEQAIREGLRKTGRWSWLWRAGEPPDHPTALEHPEGRYLKFAVLRRAL